MHHKLPDIVLLFIFILIIAIPLTSTPLNSPASGTIGYTAAY